MVKKLKQRMMAGSAALFTGLVSVAGTAHADSYEHEHYRPDKKYHYQNMPSPQYDLDRESMHLQRNHDRLERQQDQLRHRQERAHRDFSRSHDYMRGSRRR